jgi:hypothetical protein
MAKEDDDDDSLPPLGENCDKFLDQAKKGQPRSFLLVCKGNKVKYLAVKKKPVKKADLAEAKKSGYKGDAYFGVITGKGMDLVFTLSMADGYTAEPCKDKSLKDFLEEHADFKCKPTFAIVATAPAIPFDEDDLSNPLIARYLKMDEQISAVLDARPDAETELTKTVSEIRLLLQDGDFKTAEPRVIALDARLKELLSGGQATAPAATSNATPASPTPTPVATSQPSQSVDNDALRNKLQDALDKLVPQLKQAVAANPDRKVELLTPLAQIKKQMDAGDLQNARQGILTVGQLLKLILAQAGDQNGNAPLSQPPEDLRAEYESKLALVQPNFERALRELLGDTSKFRAVMAYAIEQASAGVYSSAIKALDRLGPAIEQAISAAKPAVEPSTSSSNPPTSIPSNPPKPAVSIVKLQQSILAWDEARKRIQAEVEALEHEIVELFVSDNRLAVVQQNVYKLEAILGDYAQDLRDHLDDAYNAPDEFKSKLCNEAISIVGSYRNYLGTDPFIKAVASNKLKPIDIEGVLGKTLDGLAMTLAY